MTREGSNGEIGYGNPHPLAKCDDCGHTKEIVSNPKCGICDPSHRTGYWRFHPGQHHEAGHASVKRWYEVENTLAMREGRIPV